MMPNMVQNKPLKFNVYSSVMLWLTTWEGGGDESLDGVSGGGCVLCHFSLVANVRSLGKYSSV